MYCIFCGKQITDNAVFCPYCGMSIPQRDTLAKLVAAARTGDKDAISTLYEQTYSKVYYTVKSMIKDEDAVFDIVQDTYLKAFAHLDSFQGDTKFSPWVRQIAANTARDWLKKKRPMLFTELNSNDEQDTPVEELLPDERIENLPDQVIDQKETKHLIREIIEELPEDQRAAIGMFYYEEMSVKEIAAAMGVSESAVKSRLMYGRNKIEKKVRELEKQGTKLYGLSPLLFLLLLFRSQKVHAAEIPDSQILHAILASQSAGAATAAGTAQSTGAAGTSQGATAVGGLGALKLGFIAVAAIAVVGIGAFGIIQRASRSDEPQEPSILPIEDIIDMETPEGSAPIEDIIGLETPKEFSPIDEALEQYRIILSQPGSYEYENNYGFESVSYQYALIQMQPDDPVPTLLLKMEEQDWTFASHVRVFQYDSDTKTVHQPTESIEGSIRGGLSMAADGYGMLDTKWSSGTGQTSISRITLDGDFLNRDTYWTGQIDQIPDWITFIEIEWHETGDLSALDGWTTSSEPADSGTLPTDEDRIVLTGTVRTCDYDGIIALQGQPDPNASDPYSLEYSRSLTYRVIVLDTPQTLRLQSGGGDDYFFNEALMFNINYVDGMDQYEGQHITFSIDPSTTCWPSDTSLPIGQPIVRDIHILD